ncbi:MAG TPA: ribonuclease HII [Methanomassiliicoccales archaeon]|nr:ribonuclease HII [Methanomassiliicoccales archaeon]
MDEAGRGPVLGPLVVAAVMLPDDSPLREMQVRDSKKLSAAKRDALALEIRKVARVEVRSLEPAEIDGRGAQRSLNVLEAEAFASLIERLRPDEVFVDACDAVEDNFSRAIRTNLSYMPMMVCKHRADDLYPVVSAASIIAKTVRDARIEEISRELGADIGSGYPTDEVTIRFLTNWIKEKGDLPPQARRSWETASRLLRESKTRKITDWE